MMNFDVATVFFGNSLQDYLTAFLVVLASIVMGKIVYFLINRYLKRLFAKTKTKLDDLLVDAVEEPLVALIAIAGFYAASKLLYAPVEIRQIFDNLIFSAIIVDGVWLSIRLTDIFMSEVLAPLTKKTQSQLDDQIMPILSKGIKVIAVVIGVLVVLSNFGFDVTALIAGLGIGGLAVALASKDTVENVFGAFAILFDKPFAIGDRVVIDGVTGDVMEVGLRSTRIRTLNNTQLYIPNSKVVINNVENISKPNRRIAVTETIGVTYETSSEKLEQAISIIREILANTEGVSSKYHPAVAFNEFGSFSLNIFVKYWVSDYESRLDVLDKVNRRIKKDFEKAGINFAYPTQRIVLDK